MFLVYCARKVERPMQVMHQRTIHHPFPAHLQTDTSQSVQSYRPLTTITLPRQPPVIHCQRYKRGQEACQVYRRSSCHAWGLYIYFGYHKQACCEILWAVHSVVKLAVRKVNMKYGWKVHVTKPCQQKWSAKLEETIPFVIRIQNSLIFNWIAWIQEC